MFPGNIELEPAPAVEPIPVENEPEPESLWLVVLKEPKSTSKGDSKAGITPALVVSGRQEKKKMMTFFFDLKQLKPCSWYDDSFSIESLSE